VTVFHVPANGWNGTNSGEIQSEYYQGGESYSSDCTRVCLHPIQAQGGTMAYKCQTAPCQSFGFIKAMVTPPCGGVKAHVRGRLRAECKPQFSTWLWAEKIEQPRDLERGLAKRTTLE
jgi:hypothetical protein